MYEKPTIWDTFTLGLWALFFAMGLVPELAFHLLRAAAGVSYFTAIVNSSVFITLVLTSYMTLFVYRRCRDADIHPFAASGKTVQAAIFALVAFMDLPSRRATFETHTLLEILFELDQLPDLYVKSVVVLVAVTKIAAWCYLFSLVFRYHAFGNRDVFTSIPSLIPSAHVKTEDKAPQGPKPVSEEDPPIVAHAADDSSRRN